MVADFGIYAAPIYMPTRKGQWLRIGAPPSYDEAGDDEVPICRYGFSVHTGDEYVLTDIIALTVSLLDTEGAEWQAQKLISAGELVEMMEGRLRSFFHSPVGDSVEEFSRDIQKEERFEQYQVLSGVRIWKDQYVNTYVYPHELHFSYEGGSHFDIAAIPFESKWHVEGSCSLIVRLRDVMAYIRGDDAELTSLWSHRLDGVECEGAPPIEFEISFDSLLWRPDAYRVDDDGEDSWEESRIPLPLVFSRTGETGEPQPGVTVVESYGG